MSEEAAVAPSGVFRAPSTWFVALRLALVRDVPALSVDGFRVAAGLVVLAYFARHLAEVGLYHGPDGLVPHEVSRQVFPFTVEPLFALVGRSALAVRGVYAAACALSVLLVLGVRPRLVAFALYLVAVATYRHDFLVMGVDDVLVHLALFWLTLLPTGATLTLRGREGDLRATLERWRGARVRGTMVRLFLANLGLLYFVAGASKWTSPMWRSGEALFAVLSLPMSHVAGAMRPSMGPWLRAGTYATLFVEPLLPLGIVLSSDARVRRALVVSVVVLHLSIVATVDVPFANLLCLAAIPLYFRNVTKVPTPARAERLRPSELFASAVVGTLAAAMASAFVTPPWRAPELEGPRGKAALVHGATAETGGATQTALFGALFAVGLVQQYRLLDWIDDRNFAVEVTVHTSGAHPEIVPFERVAPRDMRSSILLGYLGGVTWMPIAGEHSEEVREAIAKRLGARACRALPGATELTIEANFRRTGLPDVAPTRHVELATHTCTEEAR